MCVNGDSVVHFKLIYLLQFKLFKFILFFGTFCSCLFFFF